MQKCLCLWIDELPMDYVLKVYASGDEWLLQLHAFNSHMFDFIIMSYLLEPCIITFLFLGFPLVYGGQGTTIHG